jgi:uncharacterized tellurite resistance protein B-like protein
LDRDPQMRQKQLDALRSKAEELSYRETERLAPQIDRLPDEARVSLIETTFPALKKLSPEQYTRFRENVALLIAADEQVDLLEYTIHAVLLRNLDVQFGRAKPLAVRHHRLDPLLPSLVSVLSMLTHAGQTAEADVRRAFDKGMAEVGRSGTLQGKSDGSLRNLDAALKSLAEASPKLKKQLLAACVACVAADGQVTPREGELIQAVAAMLGVPVPPIGAQR